MNNQLTTFSFYDDQAEKNHQVRTIIDENGELYFVLRDTLAVMGSTTRPAIAKESLEQGLGDGVYKDYPA
jgi:prophage antirepressor-like protein